MKKQEGLHFYINVKNYNDIVEDEERQGGVNHSIHALDTLFSLTEQYAKTNYPGSVVIEKITGARLHLYIIAEVAEAFEIAASIISYSAQVASFMGSDIAKYKSLILFELQAGVSYGKFYEFLFEQDTYEELTTIGFACNYAAKLQNLASINSIAVSENVYNSMDSVEKLSFVRRTNPTIYKYEQRVYYEARIKQLKTRVDFNYERKDAVRNYANKRNLTDMQFSSVKRSLSLESLSTVNGRKIEGIPVFADVRDFTSQFNSDDSNLTEMAEKTRHLLEKLYATTEKHHGVHVQFQGDREFALYHNVENDKCFKDAVLGGMRMIDAVKPYSVHIGVGESFGKMYAVRIGARGEKDKLIIGRTVNNADNLEDEKAASDQLAISSEVYEGLKEQDLELAKQFRLYEPGVYVTNQGFKAYTDQLKYAKQSRETKKHGYNGAWGIDIK